MDKAPNFLKQKNTKCEKKLRNQKPKFAFYHMNRFHFQSFPHHFENLGLKITVSILLLIFLVSNLLILFFSSFFINFSLNVKKVCENLFLLWG